jgi:hypothetical protein
MSVENDSQTVSSNIPEGIVTSRELAQRTKEHQKARNKEQGVKTNEDLIEEAAKAKSEASPEERHNFKVTKKRARIVHSDPPQSDSPISVYKQFVEGEWWLWYHNERSEDVGRITLYEQDEQTMIPKEVAHDFVIPLTKENFDIVSRMATARTQWIVKTSNRRIAVAKKDFLTSTGLTE